MDAADRRYVVPDLRRRRVKQSGDIGRMRSKFNGKFWWDMTNGAPAIPGDYEAQVGQGAVTLHSEEHFGQSDRGILMIGGCSAISSTPWPRDRIRRE